MVAAASGLLPHGIIPIDKFVIIHRGCFFVLDLWKPLIHLDCVYMTFYLERNEIFSIW